MAHDICLTGFRLAGLVLAALIVNAACLIWIYSAKPVESPSGAGGGSIHDVVKFFRSPSSNSSLFLKATAHPTNQIFTELGELEWEEEIKEMGSMFLTKNRTHIQVTVAGWYVVFVKATFKLPAGNDTMDLRLQLDFTYRERTDQFASAFDTRQLLEEGQDAPLSFFVLLRMEPENRLSVMASHRKLVDYARRPVSTFITIVRCSD
ncbi:uncharacterized protein LOC121582058 [Coregonus clupeaformis]|uniref:uncharacterized protein LOC121582058 n=1 Tax=Coregonus clupeaformis TaxID=59861 RepID=UPI001BE127D4|nr:uncharacterized protein LOC121582058 [Coregonus clupeaformis]